PSPKEHEADKAPKIDGPQLEEYLQVLLCKTLGIDPASHVEPTQSFRELGLTSLMAVEICSSLGRAMGKVFPSTLLFNHPNLHALARHLREKTEPSATRVRARADASPHREPIAVVGIGCRFPGDARTPEAFWRLLEQGRDPVTEVPAERWDIDAW